MRRMATTTSQTVSLPLLHPVTGITMDPGFQSWGATIAIRPSLEASAMEWTEEGPSYLVIKASQKYVQINNATDSVVLKHVGL